MIAEIYQRVLDRFAMPAEWAQTIVAPIFKGKGDISYCSCHRAVKFLEHDGGKGARKKLCGIVTFNEVQFGLMP